MSEFCGRVFFKNFFKLRVDRTREFMYSKYKMDNTFFDKSQDSSATKPEGGLSSTQAVTTNQGTMPDPLSPSNPATVSLEPTMTPSSSPAVDPSPVTTPTPVMPDPTPTTPEPVSIPSPTEPVKFDPLPVEPATPVAPPPAPVASTNQQSDIQNVNKEPLAPIDTTK